MPSVESSFEQGDVRGEPQLSVDGLYPSGITEKIIEESPEVVLLVDESGRIVYVNRKGRDLFRTSPGASFPPVRIVEDPLFEWCRKTITLMLKERLPCYEGRFIRGNREFQTNCRLVQDKPGDSFKALIRIRERARIENQISNLAKLIDLLPHPAFIVNSENRIIVCNHKFISNFGDPKTSPLCHVLIMNKTEPCSGCPVTLFSAERTRFLVKLPIRGKKTRVLFEQFDLLPDYENAFLVAFVKEEEQEQDEDEETRDRLVSLGLLARDAVHEWKNYITILAGHLQIIEMRLSHMGNASLVSRIDQVRGQFEQMSRSILGLFETSRSEPARVPCLINDLIGSVVDFFANHRKCGGIKLDFDAGSEIPFLLLDPVQIEQVFINLFKNAAEAMAWEEGTIQIKSRYSSDNRTVKVTIADSGEGIPLAMMGSLFEDAGSSKKDGTGIGLRLSGNIVREHGGTISAESNEYGTVFRLEFPVPTDSEMVEINGIFPRKGME